MARYNCPICRGDTVQVVVRCWADLDQDDPANIQTASTDADQDWDGESDMRCVICWYSGAAHTFAEAGTGYEDDDNDDDDNDDDDDDNDEDAT